MTLQQSFENYIQQQQLFTKADKLLLAVSGGVDSVALCHLCHKAGYHFIIAHCNFQLRGAESERDEAFVKQLGHNYNAEVVVKHFDTETYATTNKLSIQVAARNLRYEWFKKLMNEKQLQYIATAHHADDAVETTLMNFFKGTGIAGLRSIQPKQPGLVRPLLFASKELIYSFATSEQLSWVEDSSNKTDKYSRNFFRHRIIPVVEEIYPQSIENIKDNISRFKEIEQLYQQAIAQHRKKLLVQNGSEWHIPVLKLQKTTPLDTVLYELTAPFGFTPQQVPDIKNLLKSDTGKYVASATHRIIKNRHWLIIASAIAGTAVTSIIEAGETVCYLEQQSLQLQQLPADGYKIKKENTIAAVDAKQLKFPLLVRSWKIGDYFYPLGMKKKKKLARFFIDQKLSKTAKEAIWVVVSDQRIVWVVGHRIDDRFKITAGTKEITELRLV
ncbi:MAG: tRNA lysidine(34) synthetase TilS [Sphingobacteriales bacterium]|nr:MAG: tRNA lysidine(34) synthetase TilS [Sphingobacteriales bacterium]